jgi:hypothetical protein
MGIFLNEQQISQEKKKEEKGFLSSIVSRIKKNLGIDNSNKIKEKEEILREMKYLYSLVKSGQNRSILGDNETSDLQVKKLIIDEVRKSDLKEETQIRSVAVSHFNLLVEREAAYIGKRNNGELFFYSKKDEKLFSIKGKHLSFIWDTKTAANSIFWMEEDLKKMKSEN